MQLRSNFVKLLVILAFPLVNDSYQFNAEENQATKSQGKTRDLAGQEPSVALVTSKAAKAFENISLTSLERHPLFGQHQEAHCSTQSRDAAQQEILEMQRLWYNHEGDLSLLWRMWGFLEASYGSQFCTKQQRASRRCTSMEWSDLCGLGSRGLERPELALPTVPEPSQVHLTFTAWTERQRQRRFAKISPTWRQGQKQRQWQGQAEEQRRQTCWTGTWKRKGDRQGQRQDHPTGHALPAGTCLAASIANGCGRDSCCFFSSRDTTSATSTSSSPRQHYVFGHRGSDLAGCSRQENLTDGGQIPILCSEPLQLRTETTTCGPKGKTQCPHQLEQPPPRVHRPLAWIRQRFWSSGFRFGGTNCSGTGDPEGGAPDPQRDSRSGEQRCAEYLRHRRDGGRTRQGRECQCNHARITDHGNIVRRLAEAGGGALAGNGKECQESSTRKRCASPRSTSRRNRRRWSFRCCWAKAISCAPAFWRGQMIDQREIICPWLGPERASVVMQWTHPVVEQPDFVAPWQACEAAAAQAFELGHYHERKPVACSRTRSTLAGRHRAVHFDDTVELLLCDHESQLGHLSHIQHKDLCFWTDKPWKLRATPACSLTQEHYDPSQPSRSPRYEAWLPGYPQTDRPNLEDMPAWTQQVWQGIFYQQAEIEFHDEGPVLYLLTWFLRFDDYCLCRQSRTAKLDLYYEHWLDDLRRLWSDLANSIEDLEIFVVYPEPPRTTGAMHSGHLIIVQGPPTPRKAILISTFESNALENHLTQVATFAPRRVHKHMIQELSQVPIHVFASGAECWIDEAWVDDVGPEVPLHDGCHVLLHVQHAGAGPRHTWRNEAPDFTDTDSDATSLLTTVEGIHKDRGTSRLKLPIADWDRCGDLLSLREAVLNSPVPPAWDELPTDGLSGMSTPMSSTGRALPPGGPHPPQPGVDYHGWTLEMWEIFNEHVATLQEGDEHSVWIRTWFLHHDNRPRCDESRELRLDAALTEWQTEIEHLWRDRIDSMQMMRIQIVRPLPHSREQRASTQSIQADVILSQPLPHPHRCILVLYDHHSDRGFGGTLVALSVTNPTPRAAFLRAAAPRANWLQSHRIQAQERTLHDRLLRFDDGHLVRVTLESTTDIFRVLQVGISLRPPLNGHCQPTAVAHGLDEGFSSRDPYTPCLYELSSPHRLQTLRLCGARLTDQLPERVGHAAVTASTYPTDHQPEQGIDDVGLMQTSAGTPRCLKDAPMEPNWYQSMQEQSQPPNDPDPDDVHDSGSDQQQTPDDPSDHDFWDLPDDPEDSEDPEPPSPQAPPDEAHRQNVMLFLRGQAPIHAYIALHDHDAMMREIANHCLVPVHRIIQLHDLTFKPEDIRNIKDLYPMIVHREFDIEPGSSNQLCLLDIELFGQRHEPHYYIGPQVNRAVWQIPRQLVRRTLLRIIGQDDHCIRASQRCIVKMNGDIWNVQDARPRRIQHGDHFCVQIPPIEDCPHSDILRAWTGFDAQATEQDAPSYSPSLGPDGSQSSFDLDQLLETDDGSLFQSQMRQLADNLWALQDKLLSVPDNTDDPANQDACSSLGTEATPGATISPTVADTELPKWVQALQPEFLTKVLAQRDVNDLEIHIQTWYLNHHSHVRCDPGRPLKLEYDPHKWHQAVRALWQDLIEDDSFCWFEIVTPTPHHVGGQPFLAHLMISQQRDDSVLLADRNVETVVTIDFEHAATSTQRQLALVMPAWSLADDFFQALGIHRLCVQRKASGRQCYITHGPNVLEIGLRDLFHHGDSLTVHVPEAQVKTTKAPSLLQRQVATKTTTSSEASREQLITADFSAVLQIREELIQTELPVFRSWNQMDLDEDLCSYVDGLPHWNGQDIYKIEFYTDGSYAVGHRVGAAAVAIGHSHDCSYFLGALAQTMYGDHAYTGELCAIVWALLWACQLTHFLPDAIMEQLVFEFYFDCVAAGYQASGWWHGKLHQDWHAVLRSLMQYLESRITPSRIWSQHVYAHAGLLPNELADRIAKYASRLCEYHQPIPWLHWFAEENLTAIQWIWAVDKLQNQDPAMPKLQGHVLQIPLKDQITDTSKGHEELQPRASSNGPDQHFTMRLATANVMTLLDMNKRTPHIIGGRQLHLMQQFHEESCHIVAIQESRHKRLNQNNEWYHVLGHPATPKGHAGIQIWIAKKLRFGSATISLNQIRVVYSDENTMILKIKLPGRPFAVIAGHAPHASRPHVESIAFWKQITAQVNKTCRGLPLFFLGDTNAHLGQITSSAVGAHGAAPENGPGQTFHDWMLAHELFAPATFAQHHSGLHATFCSIRGQHGHRLDYICLPLQWFNSEVTTWTSENIDLGLARDDHYAVCADVPFTVQRPSRPHKRTHGAIDAVHAAHWATSWDGHQALHESLVLPSWETSVHEQAVLLSRQVHQALPDSIRKQKQSFRKRHLLPETQEIIRTKQELFKRLKQLRAAERQLQLQVIFLTWKHQRQPVWSRRHHCTCAQVEHQLNVQIAGTLSIYQVVAPQAQLAVKKDDAEFLQGLARLSGDAYSVEGLQGLWKQVKRLLPKNKVKKDRQQFDLDQPMLHHFCDLEAGQVTTWQQLLDSCLSRNVDTTSDRQPLDIRLEELPTLWQTEQLCLKQKAGKCPGLDQIPGELCSHGATAIAPALHNLILKSVLQGAEPLEFKGGRLCAIYKGKGSKLEPSKYRGILLADGFAKIFHSWTRTQLLPTFQQRARPGQLGGRPSQQTTTAIHLLRLHAWNGRHLHLTTGMLFIDVRAAFHHMLRDLVFGISNPMTASQLSNFLDSNHHDIPAIAAGIQRAVQDDIKDIRPLLRFLLADIHQQTWFQMTNADDTSCYVETARGTRPGSPLADVGFNLLFAKVMLKIELALQNLPQYNRGMLAAGLEFHPIAWMDDLAIPMTTATASEMPSLMTKVLTIVHEAFSSFGLTLNMDPGKTEAVIMFRGPGADEQRLQLFDQGQVPTLVASTDTHILSLRVASSYRHLGARYSMDADIEVEVMARLGSARSAYHEVKQQVFLNRFIPVPGRLQLLHSLIFSRLMYGCATWSDMPAGVLKKIESQMMKMFRSIIDNGFWKDETLRSDSSLRAEFELPTFRLLWAKARLIYLQHFASMPECTYRIAVLQEYSRGRGWLWEVESDLTWMSQLIELPFQWPPALPIDWPAILSKLAAAQRWKNSVRKAYWRHLKRESVAWQTEDLQLCIAKELQMQGLCLQPDETLPPPQDFPCECCDRVFDTQQKLAVHRLKSHQIQSDERAFIQSTVCPGCLVDHWTTRRLQQHLRHRANGCFDKLQGVRPPEPTVHISLPEHLKGVKRLPARRIHHGPLRPSKELRLCREVQTALSNCYDLGLANGAWLKPDDHSILHARLCLHFRSCWDRAEQKSDHSDLMEDCVNVPSHLEASEAIIACSLDAWGTEQLALLPRNSPGHLALHELLQDLGTTPTRLQEATLRQQLDDLINSVQPTVDDPGVAIPRPRDHRHAMINGFLLAEQREAARLRQSGTFTQGPRPNPKLEYALVVHLYSGRRRHGDFQHWAEHFAATKSLCICVLSIDTAIDPAMNVHHANLWTTLLDAGRAGHIRGLLLGPPCETWSSARFHKLEHGTGPRPLRDRSRPWGLDLLRFPELEQLGVGSDLFLRGLWLSILVAFAHGAVILEHPAPPFDESYPTIWATWVIQSLRTYCPWFDLLVIQQWKLGSAANKPTGLMYANCRLPEWVRANELPHLPPPQISLIGKEIDGSFRTARAKEYPSAMNRALAQTIMADLDTAEPSTPAPTWWEFVQTLAASCTSLDSGCMMPDYQPKCW